MVPEDHPAELLHQKAIGNHQTEGWMELQWLMLQTQAVPGNMFVHCLQDRVSTHSVERIAEVCFQE